MAPLRTALRRGLRGRTPQPRGAIDAPDTAVVAPQQVRFEGWALAGDDVPEKVILIINDDVSIVASAGIDRPDVPTNLLRPAAAAACGWTAVADLRGLAGPVRVRLTIGGRARHAVTVAERTYDVVAEPELSASGGGPRWDWDLPDSLATTVADVERDISTSERMPAEDVDNYMRVGRSALQVIRLAQLASGVSDFTSILDMPCGHGRVMRWMQAAFPAARLTACDVLTDGVDYCAQTFGATPVYSSDDITADAFPDRYDLVFVGSLLTHLDAAHWDRLVALWHDILTPDGLLIVTTHGEFVAERMRAGHLYGYPAPGITRALRAFEDSGFAFLEEAPASIDYGISLARPAWTLARLLRHTDFRVVMAGEALWDKHQDVTAVVRRPFARSSA